MVTDLEKTGSWYIKYKGLSLKLKRGTCSLRVFQVIPNGSRDVIKVSVSEVLGNMKVTIEPNEFKLNNQTVNIEVKVSAPIEAEFKPIWLVKLKFEGTEKLEHAYLGVLPVNETCNKVIIRRAKGASSEFAVGAVGFTKYSKYYISYRWRNGNAVRGEVLEIASSEEGLNYQTIKSFNKYDYGYESFEASTLLVHDNPTLLYCADLGRHWGIFKTSSESFEKLSLPGDLIIDYGKDPTAIYDEVRDSIIIAYSNGRNRGHDLTILETKDFKSFETKVNSLIYSQFVEQGNNWARTHIHAGKIAKVDGYYVLFYDALPGRPKAFGSGWLGVALSKDLLNWIDLTPDEPLWRGGGIDKTFRYVDLYCDRDNYILYVEEEFDSGEKNLVAYYDLASIK